MAIYLSAQKLPNPFFFPNCKIVVSEYASPAQIIRVNESHCEVHILVRVANTKLDNIYWLCNSSLLFRVFLKYTQHLY